MKVADFDFDLPRALIAARPMEPRDAARLLVIGAGLADRGISDLPGLLRPGDILVVNDTLVIPARLHGRRGAAKVEITLHKPLGEGRWHAFAKGARKLRVGDSITFGQGVAAAVEDKGEGGEVTYQPTPHIIHRHLTLIGSWTFSTFGLAEAARFVADRNIPLRQLITRSTPIESAPAAYEAFASGEPGKFVISWP